jgi:sporulation integral membrane protein YtvI
MSWKTILVLITGLAFLYALFTVGFPFLLAIVIAIFLEPLIQLLMKYARFNRIAAATTVCTLFTIVTLLLLYLLGLKIISELVVLSRKIPGYWQQLTLLIEDFMDRTALFFDSLSPEMARQLNQGLDAGMNTLNSAVNNLLSKISGMFITAFTALPSMLLFYIVFAVALYLFCYSMPRLKHSFLSLFEEASREKVESVLFNLRGSIFGFIRAQFILSSITYIVTLLGLLILDVNYPLAIALMIVIVDLLPILGTGSFIVPWAGFNLITGNIFLAAGLVILFIFITVLRRIIEPKILGDSIGIGALPTLISIYVGFKLVGAVGLFLGPIVVIVYQAMRKVGLLDIKIKLV